MRIKYLCFNFTILKFRNKKSTIAAGDNARRVERSAVSVQEYWFTLYVMAGGALLRSVAMVMKRSGFVRFAVGNQGVEVVLKRGEGGFNLLVLCSQSEVALGEEECYLGKHFER